MGDLKTPFNDPGLDNIDSLSGAGVLSSGSDPNADGGDGPGGLRPVWSEAPVTRSATAETPNSFSGLPPLPNRVEPPSPNGVTMPDLTTRNPGTIDQR